MKVICLLESVSRADGGIFGAECALQRELSQNHGMSVDVVGLEDPYTVEDRSKWLPIIPKSVKTRGPIALGYSPDLLPSLDPNADLLYAATLWKYPSWAALRWAEQTGRPMIAAPHGSLDAWALRNAAWKKEIAARLFKDRQLRKATCLRALCREEADAFRAYGLKNPVAIIPNGIDLPNIFDSGDERQVTRDGQKKLLFLGRIHPKKGLVNALRAFAESRGSSVEGIRHEKWQFVIAGWDQGGHEADLKLLCDELGLLWTDRRNLTPALDFRPSSIDSAVHFHGPAFGEEKDLLLRSADAFILSSFSEGLPMSVLEAWAYRLPVLMTSECNLLEGFAVDAAITIDTGVASIADGLNTLFQMKECDLSAMGGNGYQLVKERFTWPIVARQMRAVYDWVLGGGTQPECVKEI